ncbi:MAG: ABC transporter ATP-binding protein [Pseudomonadota bacterium]
MADLVADNLTLNVKDATLVETASFSLQRGEFTVLLGPNGAGKTSLIRASLGLEVPTSGTATLGGEDTRQLSPVARARNIAYLPQIRPLAWPNTVRDVVALGRFSHGAALGRLKGADAEAVARAIAACDLTSFAHRRADTLSGGELARMHCARAFAAEAPLLVADEPTAALDPRHQFRILDLIADFVKRGGGALVVLHDIQMAASYASRLIWMKDGRIVANGPPTETLTSERLESIYGIRAEVNDLRIDMEGPV